jgi:hypothetical protein
MNRKILLIIEGVILWNRILPKSAYGLELVLNKIFDLVIKKQFTSFIIRAKGFKIKRGDTA